MSDFDAAINAYIAALKHELQRLAWLDKHPFGADLSACAETNS